MRWRAGQSTASSGVAPRHARGHGRDDGGLRACASTTSTARARRTRRRAGRTGPPRGRSGRAPRRVAVLRDGTLVDAVATGGPGRARLKFEAGGAEADADLNDANHFELPPEIAGVAEWRDRRRAYLATRARRRDR